MTSWRYLAQDLTGDRGIFHNQVPLTGVTVTRVLSGPGNLSGTVPVEILSLKEGGKPLLRKWGTALWAERDGVIYGGGIVTGLEIDDDELSVDCTGISGYPNGMPYIDSKFFIHVDPLDLVRHIWEHLQGQPGGDLGLHVDQTTSPVRIGIEVPQDEYDPPGGDVPPLEEGAIRFSWYETSDLGDEIDKLAQDTPFDYIERSVWSPSRSRIDHRLELGYPRLGVRRHDLRFVFGENIAVIPRAESLDEDWGNEVLLLGAGEGREMIHYIAHQRDPDRVRRVAVVVDKGVRRMKRAKRQARLHLSRMNDDPVVTEITVHDHPNAPLGSWALGDDIYLAAKGGWLDVSGWFRIIEFSVSPDDGDDATLSLLPTEPEKKK